MGLRNEHVEAADRLAAGRGRLAQQARRPRVVDEVVHQPAAQRVGGDRRLLRVGMHAHRRAVHQQIPAAGLGRPRARLRRDDHRHLLGAPAIARVHADLGAARREGNRDGPCRPAGAQNRHAQAGHEQAPCLQRSEKPAGVRVPTERAAVDDSDGVDRADTSRHGIRLVDALEQRDLERNRHARALQADRVRKRHEVVGVGRLQRQVDGVEPGGPKRRVVHRRRHRVRHRRADDSVHVGRFGHRAESILLEHFRDAQLADARDGAGISPARFEPSGEHTRGQPRFTHRDEHHLSLLALRRAQIEQGQAIAEAVCRRGDLDDLRPRGPHRARGLAEVARHRAVVVHRQHDPTPADPRDQIVEMRVPFDVHVLGAEGQRLAKQPPALFLRSPELTAFPRRTAGDDDRPAAARERAGDARILDRIETQLDQIGVSHQVPLAAEVRRRRGRHGYAETRPRHVSITDQKKSLFNRGGLKRLELSSRGGRSGQGGCLFRCAPIPPGRRRRAAGGTGRRREEDVPHHRNLRTISKGPSRVKRLAISP